MIASMLFMGLKNANAQINLETVTIKGNATKAMITEKVSNSFNKIFKDATEPSWVEINKRFVVNFILNDQKNKAVFTKNGNLVYHLAYGTEKNIPDIIRERIQKNYEDYDITSAIRVNTPSVLVWVVNIENNKKIITLRATEDDITEIDTLPKS